MTRPDIDLDLTAWLESRAPQRAPEHLLGATVHRTARTRPRPAWRTTERWTQMTVALRPSAFPRGLLFALVTLGLLLALAAATLLTGGRPSFFAAVVPPVGPAANGLIAFEYQGDIYTVKPDGSERTLVVSEAGMQYSPSWSPDGTQFAYWSGVPEGEELVVVAADGSNPVRVATDVVEVTGWTPAAWSPDGAKLAFSARTDTDGQCLGTVAEVGNFCSSRLFMAASDGSTGTVQMGDPDVDAREAVWSPDASSIAFSAGHSELGIGLFLMDPDGTDIRRLGDVTGTGWGMLRLGWSPDGSSIVGTAGGSTWNIWVTDVDDGSSAIVSDPPAEPAVLDELFPTYAPDGAIAWERAGNGACGCLTVLEMGGEPIELADLAGPPSTWSPDGELIALTGVPTSSGALVLADRAGNVVTTIADVATQSTPSWQRLAP